MGSYLSCYIPPIDKYIEKKIYYPPLIDKYYYPNTLNTYRSRMVEYLTRCKNKVSAVYIVPEKNTSPKKYIVFSHGNGSDILTMFSYLMDLSDKLDVGIFAYDYLGYGQSEKINPSEQGCYNSLEATIDYLLYRWKMDPNNIYMVGHSLGTGVVVEYISNYNWNTPVILISPFKSICKIVTNIPCIGMIDKFETQKKLKNVTCPVKIFHGYDDEVINISHAMDIYKNLKNKTFEPVWFDDVGHNDILDVITTEHYLEVLNYNN